jgi:predicted  nucleic acid-binding Zn-ribbon protein
MQAEPAVQALLIKVAEIDNTATMVARRKKALPQHAELSELNGQRMAASEAIVALQTRISDANVELERQNGDLDIARTRLQRDRQRIDDGTVNQLKQIAGLQAEIDHLTGRIAALEDESLVIMQAIEDDEAQVVAQTAQRSGIEDRMRALIASRDAQIGQADQEAADLARERADLVAQVPGDVMALYTKVAARAGTGAAELRNRRCSGCGMELDATALRAAADAAPNAIVRCDECGRILVRPFG